MSDIELGVILGAFGAMVVAFIVELNDYLEMKRRHKEMK